MWTFIIPNPRYSADALNHGSFLLNLILEWRSVIPFVKLFWLSIIQSSSVCYRLISQTETQGYKRGFCQNHWVYELCVSSGMLNISFFRISEDGPNRCVYGLCPTFRT
jgi:hypothetical protein